MCGEKEETDEESVEDKGSPPRVRGKEQKAQTNQAYTGITPACAGKRRSAVVIKTTWGDHPRVCGEKLLWMEKDFPVEGSPPRVRGKAQKKLGLDLKWRITPACAGKSP